MGKALDGVRVLDMTHVQAGPACTQMLAWLGADVVKVEMPGRGDITRGQLRDIPDQDSLYFTMLNGNKRSITLNTKSEKGKEIFTKLLKESDVIVENFAPGALDRQGFTWEKIQEINPRVIYASIKGFGEGGYKDFKAYEPIAQAMGGSMSTTGFPDGPPMITGSQVGDTGTGMHALAGILAALIQREKTGKGQRVEVAMQHAVMNLCRVKFRDQQRVQVGPLKEYPNKEFKDYVPRAANASGGGQPGWALRCAPGGENDYIYVVVQPQVFAPLMKLIGREELIEDPDFATPEARVTRLEQLWGIIEEWTSKYTKWEVMEKFNAIDVPCGPVLSTKDIIEDESLRSEGAVAAVNHPKRGTYYTIGNPLRLSDNNVEIGPSPDLGEHTDDVLKGLGYTAEQIEQMRADGAI